MPAAAASLLACVCDSSGALQLVGQNEPGSATALAATSIGWILGTDAGRGRLTDQPWLSAVKKSIMRGSLGLTLFIAYPWTYGRIALAAWMTAEDEA